MTAKLNLVATFLTAVGFAHRSIVPEFFWIYKASAKLCSRRMVRNLLRMRAAHDTLVLPFVETSHRRCQTLNPSGCYTEFFFFFCCLSCCRTLHPSDEARLANRPDRRRQPEGRRQWTNVTALASPRAARLHAPRQRRSPTAAYYNGTVTLLVCQSR